MMSKSKDRHFKLYYDKWKAIQRGRKCSLVPTRRRASIGLLAVPLLLMVVSYPFLPNTELRNSFGPFGDTSIYDDDDIDSVINRVIPPLRERRVDCAATVHGRVKDIDAAVQLSKRLTKLKTTWTPSAYARLTRNCKLFILQRGYILYPLSREELEFPIAFSIMVSEEMEMSERLLRAIYRPQNYYCVHVSLQSEALYKAYESISSCLPNVILPLRRVFVKWDRFSALDAELSCLETLWPFTRWKYFINLNEKEFPLKSNAELVQILQSLDGANDVHASRNDEHAEKWPFDHAIHSMYRPFRGSPHITASRAFVDYALHHSEAESLLEWVKALKSHHHEIFFSTLNHNPNLEVPGSHIAAEESDYYTKPHISQYRVTNTSVDQSCKSGSWDNADCVLSFGDLPEMLRSEKLFASKFHVREDPLVVSCLEERLYNETKSNFINAKSLNVSYYRNLNFVLSHVRVQE